MNENRAHLPYRGDGVLATKVFRPDDVGLAADGLGLSEATYDDLGRATHGLPDVGPSFTTTVSSDGTNPSNGDTITIGNITYRFEGTLALANDVKIGASSDATLDNLALAVNGSGVAGTNYFAGTQQPKNITAAARAGTGATGKVTFTASATNYTAAYPSTETSSHLSFGATVFQEAGAGGSTQRLSSPSENAPARSTGGATQLNTDGFSESWNTAVQREIDSAPHPEHSPNLAS
jgi:hypothetical protein